jgi:hypothetical protein
VDWVRLIQDMNRWRTLVNTIMKLCVPYVARNLIDWVTNFWSRSICSTIGFLSSTFGLHAYLFVSVLLRLHYVMKSHLCKRKIWPKEYHWHNETQTDKRISKLLNEWNRVLLENLIVAQLISTFYWSQESIIVFTKACYWYMWDIFHYNPNAKMVV